MPPPVPPRQHLRIVLLDAAGFRDGAGRFRPNLVRALAAGGHHVAVGNPHGLGWTYTQGNVSQFRTQAFDGRRLRVVQISTALNPGNSGGGLYDKDGFLIGINTWAQDKRVSEGLNFAISADALADLLPAELRPAFEKRGKR